MAYFDAENVAIITGASSGIGAGTAVKLAELGISKFCLTGRNLDRLRNTEQICIEKSKGNASGNIILVQGDISEKSVCEKIVSEALNHFGKIDILINNAGIFKKTSFETLTLSDFDKVMETNVRSVIVLTQLCIPHLKKTKGNVVNVSSISGVRSNAVAGVYCMSKAALDMFTQCLALELAPEGVRVNSVNPAVVETNIFKNSGLTEEENAAYYELSKKIHPIGRYGNVGEVAEVIAFLSSDKASFMTGNLTMIDGGRSLLCPR